MAPLSGLLGIMMLSGFMWVPRFCFPSNGGALSSPLNLRVDVLDFHARVVWGPGPGNPNNTSYVLELKEFGRNWVKKDNCSMTMFTCDLDDFDDIWKGYFVRVKSVWKNESSKWTNHTFFNPFTNTNFSPPLLNLFVKNGSIFADVQHPLTKKEKLQFHICLYRHGTMVVCNKVSEGDHPFDNLPPDRYCLKAYVYEADRGHLGFAKFAQECIVIHPDDAGEWSRVRVALGVSFLLILPLAVILISVSCYLWPRPKYLRTPGPLVPTVKAERPNLLEVNPEKFSAVEILHQTCNNAKDLVPKHNEDNKDNTSLTSDHKVGSTCTRDTSSVCHVGEICLEVEDDPGTNSLHLSAGYGLAPDCSDEDTTVEEALLHAASYLRDTDDECKGNEGSNGYMERLMVGAQWQIHVPSKSSNRQSARSSASLVSLEGEAQETPSSSWSVYMPHPPVCYHSDEDNYQ